jgi:L-amino acid N-acyltransferase YncA
VKKEGRGRKKEGEERRKGKKEGRERKMCLKTR